MSDYRLPFDEIRPIFRIINIIVLLYFIVDQTAKHPAYAEWN